MNKKIKYREYRKNWTKDQVKKGLKNCDSDYFIEHKIRVGEIIKFEHLSDKKFNEIWNLVEKYTSLRLTEFSNGFYKTGYYFRRNTK